MTHNATAPIDAEQSKLAAHAIKKRLDELQSPLKLNHAYEALAIAHRYPNWATMKAALSPPNDQHVTPAPKFKLGTLDGDVPMDIEPHRALDHIHAFSASHGSRRELLLKLSQNAISNSSALVFVEPVSVEDLRSRTMTDIIDMASNAERSQDVFVLDVSHAQTRLGNRFNVLADADDPVDIAHLFMSAHTNYSSSSYFEYAKIIEAAAGRAIKRLEQKSGAVLTGEMVLDEVSKIASGATSLPDVEASIQARAGGAVSEVAKWSELIVRQALEKHARYFDATSAWRGPGQAIIGRNILLVFFSREPGDFERVLEKLVVKAINKAVVSASKDKRRYPDMVVSNDVDGFSSTTLAQAATAHGVCLVLGDQCQSLPLSLTKASTQFRSDHSNVHYVLNEDGNKWSSIGIWK
jgi:hypothetical protein